MENPLISILGVIFLVGLGCLISYSEIKDIIRIRRTPTSGINALPTAGRVEIVGKVEPASITSPLSETACAFWQVEVKKKRSRSKGGSYWETIYEDSSEEPFEIKDETGKIKIIPQNADLILNDNLEESSSLFNTLDERILNKLQKINIETKSFLGFDKSFKVYERLIKPGEQIYVLAEIHEMDGLSSFAERISPLLISDRSERELLKTLYGSVAVKVFGVLVIGGFFNIVMLNGGF